MWDKGNSTSAVGQNGQNGGTYEFRIKGRLDDRWLDWFEGMTLRYIRDDQTGMDVTEIRATITDQPALHGFLNKIRDLNLTLLSMRRAPLAPSHDQKGNNDAEEGE
jgi:hypothetical protein